MKTIARSLLDPDRDRLDSWKEIAVYLGREVRTAQRWEKREGLPVQKLSNSPMLPTIAVDIGHADLDALYAAIGENHVSAHSVAQRIARELRGGDHEEQLPTTARQVSTSALVM